MSPPPIAVKSDAYALTAAATISASGTNTPAPNAKAKCNPLAKKSSGRNVSTYINIRHIEQSEIKRANVPTCRWCFLVFR